MALQTDASVDVEVRHLVAVGNAVAAACNYDGPRIARGLIVLALTIVGSKAADKTTLAIQMVQAASELDSDISVCVH